MKKHNKPSVGSWEHSVIAALKHLGGASTLSGLYDAVEQQRTRRGFPLNPTFHATIRRTCQQSAFLVQDEKGSGCWRLTNPVTRSAGKR